MMLQEGYACRRRDTSVPTGGNRWLVDLSRFRPRSLLVEPERVDRVTDGHRDELLPVHRVAHRLGVYRPAEGDVPKRFAGCGVQGVEIPFDAGTEDEVAGRGQHAGPGARGDGELPLYVTSRWFDGPDRAVVVVDWERRLRAATGERVPLVVVLLTTEEHGFAVE